MLLMLHTRSRAATTIQSTWRGWVQQRKWQPVWEAHMQQKQQLQAATVLQQVRMHAVRWEHPASGTLHCVSCAWICFELHAYSSVHTSGHVSPYCVLCRHGGAGMRARS
jgi:hypothetical protein